MNSHYVMAQEWDFVGSSEITFVCGGKRVILTVTYKGGGGGSILFHQASWDPVFLADINPEDSVDLDQLLSGKVKVLLGCELLVLYVEPLQKLPKPTSAMQTHIS